MSDTDWYERAHGQNIDRLIEFYGEKHRNQILVIYAGKRLYEESNGSPKLYMPLFTVRAAELEMWDKGILTPDQIQQRAPA